MRSLGALLLAATASACAPTQASHPPQSPPDPSLAAGSPLATDSTARGETPETAALLSQIEEARAELEQVQRRQRTSASGRFTPGPRLARRRAPAAEPDTPRLPPGVQPAMIPGVDTPDSGGGAPASGAARRSMTNAALNAEERRLEAEVERLLDALEAARSDAPL